MYLIKTMPFFTLLYIYFIPCKKAACFFLSSVMQLPGFLPSHCRVRSQDYKHTEQLGCSACHSHQAARRQTTTPEHCGWLQRRNRQNVWPWEGRDGTQDASSRHGSHCHQLFIRWWVIVIVALWTSWSFLWPCLETYKVASECVVSLTFWHKRL